MEALYTLNSPPVVSFNESSGAGEAAAEAAGLAAAGAAEAAGQDLTCGTFRKLGYLTLGSL